MLRVVVVVLAGLLATACVETGFQPIPPLATVSDPIAPRPEAPANRTTAPAQTQPQAPATSPTTGPKPPDETVTRPPSRMPGGSALPPGPPPRVAAPLPPGPELRDPRTIDNSRYTTSPPRAPAELSHPTDYRYENGRLIGCTRQGITTTCN